MSASHRDSSRVDPDLAGFASVPDYIYGITRQIWEERGIGIGLQRYYAPDVIVRSPAGVTCGNTGVVAQTLQTLHQFPDRRLVGEDVIWTAHPDLSFLSSHRLISVMTHHGSGDLGPATGRPVRSRIIADCWVVNGKVQEEWLVRDQAAFARCLGTSAEELALRQVTADLEAGRSTSTFAPSRDRPSKYNPGIPQDPTLLLLVERLERLWSQKSTCVVREIYAAGASIHIPGGGSVHGHSDIDRFVIGYLAAFPDSVFRVHRATVMREAEHPVRIALGWSLEGTHGGYGIFGAPTGAPVHVMGLSHLWQSAGSVQLEWLLTDEVSIWKQIHYHRLTRGRS
jgi:hypothetical protein